MINSLGVQCLLDKALKIVKEHFDAAVETELQTVVVPRFETPNPLKNRGTERPTKPRAPTSRVWIDAVHGISGLLLILSLRSV